VLVPVVSSRLLLCHREGAVTLLVDGVAGHGGLRDGGEDHLLGGDVHSAGSMTEGSTWVEDRNRERDREERERWGSTN
jgi:hypothetical protein